MAPVTTLTFNPSLDLGVVVDEVVPERKLRFRDLRAEPGGGGVNVARVVRRLGVAVDAVLPVGGPPGEEVAGLLEAEDVHTITVPIAGSTRRSFHVHEASGDGREFRFVGPGPRLSATDYEGCVTEAVDDAGEWLVVSGSLPPGVPADVLGQLVERAHELGTRVAVDTSGDALAVAVDAGVDVLKPNRRELRELARALGHGSPDDEAAVAADLVARGVGTVLVSLGSDGAHAVGQDLDPVDLTGPDVEVRSRVGAGDSMLGATVWALVTGRSTAEAVRFGIAGGAAAVATPGSELCRREDVLRLVHDVRP